MYDVVALGELLIDFAAVSSDGEGYPTMAAHPGGAPANFLAAVNRFGGKTAMIGKVGNDTFGRLLLGTLEKCGTDISGMRVTDEFFTTLAFVTFDGKGERSFAFSRKPGADTRLSFEEVDTTLIDKTRAFHFGTLSLTHEPARTATYRAVEYARAAGKLISFDPNLRRPLWSSLDEARGQMEWGLHRADIVKLSDEEADFLWGIAPEEAAEKLVREYGVKLAFVTCGAKGCVYRSVRCAGAVPALGGLRVIDTCGAGDIFGGSAVWGVLQSGAAPEELDGDELRKIVEFATAAAGLSTERSGGISSIPSPEEVENRIKLHR